jgi:plastocyanin
MRTLPRPTNGPTPTLLAALVSAALLVGCGRASSGIHHAPPSLDPASPMVVAQDTAFDHTEISVPAGKPFVLVFDNRDTGTHNVSIYAGDRHGDRRFDGEFVDGPAKVWYPVPALTPGTYLFACDLHSGMEGTLTAT